MKYTAHNDLRQKATLKCVYSALHKICEQYEINETATKSNGIESMWAFYINQP